MRRGHGETGSFAPWPAVKIIWHDGQGACLFTSGWSAAEKAPFWRAAFSWSTITFAFGGPPCSTFMSSRPS
jgi:hypothetical protein